MTTRGFDLGETTAVRHCPARGRCPLGRLCGESHDGERLPLVPSVSEVDKGEMLWVDQRFDQRVLCLRSGIAACFTCDREDERPTPVSLLGSGVAIGLAELYVTRSVAQTYYLSTLTPCEVCSFPARAARHHLESTPGAFYPRVLAAVLTNITAAAHTQTRIVARPLVTDRIVMLLMELRELAAREGRELGEVSLTHDELAQLVAAGRASVTRALSRLAEEGVVELGYRSVTPRTEMLAARLDLVDEARTAFHVVSGDRP